MNEGVRLKSKIVYIVIALLTVVLLWLGDEGKQPIVYRGTELQHSVGLIDSESALVLQNSVARFGTVANTPSYVVNRGSYRVTLQYSAEDKDSVLELWEQGDKIAAWPINSLEGELTADFTLSKDAKALQFRINYGGEGALTIKKLTFSPQTLFYTDTYFMILVFLAVFFLGWKCFLENGTRLSQGQLIDLCVILGAALVATTPLMQTYLYNGDDLCYHLARLEGLKDGILDGQIPVNILPEGLQNNGYLNAMYPYLFLYIGAFLRICRVSLALSYKTIIFLANLGSAVCAYAAVKSIVRDRRCILLATVLYTLMPYRFTNILHRGDLGETLALIFWPMVIAGLYHVVMGDRKKWYYLVIGFSGALQSHILSAAYVAAFCVFTALFYCVRIAREKRYVEILRAAGLSLLLNAWYLVPFLYYFFKEDLNKDVLRWSAYYEQSINPSIMTQSLSLYNKQYFSLGFALLGCLGIGVLYLLAERREKKEDMDGFLAYLLVAGILFTFLCTGYFPSRALMENDFFHNIGTMLQFPWRFLGPASACFVFVGAVGLSRSKILAPCKNAVLALLVGLSLLIVITVPTDNIHMPYQNAEAQASKGHETKLGTSVGLFYPHEWRLTEATDERLVTSVVVSDYGAVSIQDYKKEGTKAAVAYTASDSSAHIELPIQSYLGYRAKDENGKTVELLRGDGGRIRFLVNGDGAQHQVYVRYGPVPGFVIADIVSALTLLSVLWKSPACRVLRRRMAVGRAAVADSDAENASLR
ncbi:MAG: 6-pyruvoyl-tetrahydropterin synthase-related protein [Bacteroidales bacterium]|nr:6-pyruvoyl-tetrahydropterin synthase-related protein [Bacteroidales bacterium]MCM1415514.1 6-pyruvoyl-tetrahydropterin synthase-related protein [bacterium]MCM1423714.1 6-pyruvoyl-tetrahydropterin synthase-related protein [bacterium]